MTDHLTRRDFVARSAGVVAASALFPFPSRQAPLFKISLAQWSLHRALGSKQLDHLDFARVARQEFGIEAIEYVNSFFRDRARDAAYLAEMNRRAADQGVYQHLIMCDGEGRLGDPDPARRTTAVENHHKWVEAAKTLGCATIRVNAASEGSFGEQQRLAADGLRRLCEFADGHGINVIVENHGGLSSHGDWLAGVMKLVDHPRVGTLPDFGNFYEYDRYQGVADLMPWARAVSAKSHAFDADGNETTKDYRRLLRIVRDAGFRSWIGIEYEGDALPEHEGIRKTRALLERVRNEMTAR
ncbi:MAG TPA: sugar phosphate isomerase/epimerase family protein [Gemmatimonadales bacterium]|nr:sugar phosphate isomerase/epimerase family protein [Gemmatimonadales bacterium]